jgi:hypothetical protein
MATRSRTPKSRPPAPVPPVLNEVVTDGELHEPLPDVKLPHAPVRLADREQRIAVRAYLYAESRGFEPGHDLDDWFAAEREIDGPLSGMAVD